MFPEKRILGVTVVPWQVETGNAWNRRLGLYPRAQLALADYTSTGFQAASVDGAVAIESACHAEGPDKVPFVREAARILKPGCRLVVADAFLKNPERPLDWLSSRLHATLSRSFVLPGLAQVESFAAAMTREGFADVSVEDISWHVAPSVLHAPGVVASFALMKLLRRERLGEHSRNNLKGSILSALLGANRFKFGYYVVSGTKS